MKHLRAIILASGLLLGWTDQALALVVIGQGYVISVPQYGEQAQPVIYIAQPPVAYGPPPVAYATPPVAYATPPVAYATPPVVIGPPVAVVPIPPMEQDPWGQPLR